MSETVVREPLSRRRLVDAALEMIEEGGIGAFSMRKLAKTLGVSAPSLYWHCRNQQDLWDAIVSETMREVDLSYLEDMEWTEQVRAYGLAMRQWALSRPGLLDVWSSATKGPSSGNPFGITGVRIMTGAGFEGAAAARAARFLNWHVWGSLLVESRLGWVSTSNGSRVYQLDPGPDAFPLADEFPDVFPYIFRVDADEQFAYALDRITATLVDDPARSRRPGEAVPTRFTT